MAVCKTCAAHKETIKALHMVIAAQTQSLKLLADRTVPAAVHQGLADIERGDVVPDWAAHGLPEPELANTPDPDATHGPRLWRNDDEELLYELRAAEEIDDVEFDKRLAAVQAMSPKIVPYVR